MTSDEAEQSMRVEFARLMAIDLQAKSDEDFARFLQGTVATLEACQKEFERRALKNMPAAGRA